MKIVMTASEVSAMHNILDTVENGSTAALLETIETNPLLDRRAANDGSGWVMLEIDPDYMTDVLRQSTTMAGVVYPCLKAAYGAFQGYIKTVADLAQAHAKRAMHNIRRRTARNVNHRLNTTDPVSCDHIIKILKANGVKRVCDLQPSQQDMLRKAYSAEVIKSAEALLLVTGNDNYAFSPDDLGKK